MKRATGFTIVELMIVLVVAAVLAGIAVPAMGTFIKNNRIKAQGFELWEAIQYARSEAAKRKVRVLLCRSPNPNASTPSCGGTSYTWTTGFLVFAAGDGNSTYESANDTLLRIGSPMPEDVTIKTNGTCNNNLEYNPDGTTNEGGGTASFAICDGRGGAHGRQINVAPHGRPKMTKGTAGSPIDCVSPT